MFQLLNVKKLKEPILFVAPHPDDDILSSGGLIQRAVQLGKLAFILFLTVGDASYGTVRNFLRKPIKSTSFIQLGKVRHNEAVRAARIFRDSYQSFIFFPVSILS